MDSNQWARISSLLVRKFAKQCKARRYEWLDPSIKKEQVTRLPESETSPVTQFILWVWSGSRTCRFIHGCYPIGEGAHMYNLQTSSGLSERTCGQRPRTRIGFPSLRRRIQPPKGIFRSGSRSPEGFSTRVFYSSTTEGADKLASEAAAGSSNQVDLFGESLVSDLLDVPTSVPIENPTVNSSSSEVDLFADAGFVSASSHVDKAPSSQT